MMESFFDRLELELRAAAQRPPRRLAGWGTAARGGAIALAVAAAAALALIPALVLLGGGDNGTVRPATDSSQRAKPHGRDHRVVATGTAPLGGPWQLEVYRGSGLKDSKTGEVLEKAGLPCLDVYLVKPPYNTIGGTGYCGMGFRKTPGFTRVQANVPSTAFSGVREVLVFGRVPKRATSVVITADHGVRLEVKPRHAPRRSRNGFYLIPVKPRMKHARVNWLDRDGNEGSRGIGLMPPASGRVKRG